MRICTGVASYFVSPSDPEDRESSDVGPYIEAPGLESARLHSKSRPKP